MQVVDALRIDASKRAREEVGLLLIVAFQAETIARLDKLFEDRDRVACLKTPVAHQARDARQTFVLAPAARIPGRVHPGGVVLGRKSYLQVVARSAQPQCVLKPGDVKDSAEP